MKPLEAIVAHSKLGIGYDGGLPWKHNADDMKRFEELTAGKTLLMGRKTFESLPALLKDRKHFVVSRTQQDHSSEQVTFFQDVISALYYADDHPDEQIIVIGGKMIYHQTFPYTCTYYVTEIKENCLCDVFIDRDDMFEVNNHRKWKSVVTYEDAVNKFITYERKMAWEI